MRRKANIQNAVMTGRKCASCLRVNDNLQQSAMSNKVVGWMICKLRPPRLILALLNTKRKSCKAHSRKGDVPGFHILVADKLSTVEKKIPDTPIKQQPFVRSNLSRPDSTEYLRPHHLLFPCCNQYICLEATQAPPFINMCYCL